MTIISDLWSYFQFVGTASLVGWIVVVVAVMVLAIRKGWVLQSFAILIGAILARFTWEWLKDQALNWPGFGEELMYLMHFGLVAIVIGIAVMTWRKLNVSIAAVIALAFVLAWFNAEAIEQIRVDYSEENAKIRAEAEAKRKAAMAEVQEKAPNVAYAEDTKAERMDMAGMTQKEKEKLKGPEVEVGPDFVKQGGDPRAYRQRGKQERTAGKSKQLDEFEEVKEEKTEFRAMKAEDVKAANRWKQFNNGGVMVAIWAAIILLTMEYLSRFNRSFPKMLLVPIAGRWVDGLFRKTHVLFIRVGQHQLVKRYLEKVIAKGETFIYLGERDPWGGIDARQFYLRPREIVGEGGVRRETTYVLESAWFGRRSFSVCGHAAAKALVYDLRHRLAMRKLARAAARRTVSVVWDFDATLPDAVLDDLAFYCREANFKLVVTGKELPASRAGMVFEEVLDIDDVRTGESGKPGPAKRQRGGTALPDAPSQAA